MLAICSGRNLALSIPAHIALILGVLPSPDAAGVLGWMVGGIASMHNCQNFTVFQTLIGINSIFSKHGCVLQHQSGKMAEPQNDWGWKGP